MGLLEGPVLEATAEVERGRLKGALKVRGESGWGPHGAGSEESGKDGLAARAVGRAGPMKGADGGGFFGGVAEPLAGEGRFDFEDGVDAFGGDVDSGGVGSSRPTSP